MTYQRNAEFRLNKDDRGRLYFRHAGGGRIRTDRTVAAVWRRAHGQTFDQLYEDLNRTRAMSLGLLRRTLELLTAAELLVAGDSAPLAPPRPPADVSVGRQPLVSIIIVNYNGRIHLEDLLPSLEVQQYPSIETIVVDNHSSDGSVEWLQAEYPEAKIVRPKRKLGFAAANNRGINAATGDYFLLLNNDTKLEQNCVAELVRTAAGLQRWGAIAPKMRLFHLPPFLNSIGNSVPAHGWGYDNFIGHLDLGQFDHVDRVFSACFGAALLNRYAVERVGLLDEGYHFYYEDSDWCYRAWSQGFDTYVAPRAVVYHKFSATMKTLDDNFKLRLVIRNRLRWAAKNLSPGSATVFLRNYLKEDARHVLGSARRFQFGKLPVYLRGWGGFLAGLPATLRQRAALQREKIPGRRRDGHLFSLWPEEPPLLDEENCPYLAITTIRSIYMHLDPPSEEKQPATPVLSSPAD